jgi:hypothetical protein
VAGNNNRVIHVEIQHEIQTHPPDCRFALYPGYGYKNDQENPAYEGELLAFVS